MYGATESHLLNDSKRMKLDRPRIYKSLRTVLGKLEFVKLEKIRNRYYLKSNKNIKAKNNLFHSYCRRDTEQVLRQKE